MKTKYQSLCEQINKHNHNYYIFLDTVKMYGGTLMFHVFYKWV